MCRRHQTPERTFLPVPSESIIDARPCHRSATRRQFPGRRILRTVLPQGIRRHRQQEEALVTTVTTHIFRRISEHRGKKIHYSRLSRSRRPHLNAFQRVVTKPHDSPLSPIWILFQFTINFNKISHTKRPHRSANSLFSFLSIYFLGMRIIILNFAGKRINL